TITPEEFGFERCQKADLLGGTPEENAATVRAILAGEECGPKRDAALLNAGAALYVCGIAQDVAQGIDIARQQIETGAATRVLDALVEESNR
ncbi:MAG: hypothetical protein IJI16_06770, partial [Atopobiaceae bacterium]|nr:hypothetical protein [Atopobiaceae bacterium]